MDARYKVYSKVYHNNGPAITLPIIAKSLYTDCKLIEPKPDRYEVTFPSIDVSRYAIDYSRNQRDEI